MRLIWILLACSLMVSPGVLAVGMGISGPNVIDIDVGETAEVTVYFRGSAAEGGQELIAFFENPTDGVSFNGKKRLYERNIEVDPNENTFVDVDIKGLKAGTYAVNWGQYSDGGSGGLALDARGQSTITVRVHGEDEEEYVAPVRSGGGGGGGGSRTSTNVTSSCAGKYELIGSAWMCVSKNATTNITTAVPTTPPVVKESDEVAVQDVSEGEGGIAQGVIDESPGRTAVERVEAVVDAVQSTTQGDVAKSALVVVLGIGLLAIVLQGALVYYAGRKE